MEQCIYVNHSAEENTQVLAMYVFDYIDIFIKNRSQIER